MGRKSMKRARKGRETNKAGIKSLPSELMLEIIAKVASTSLTDLFNVKLSCKYFLGLAKDDYIFQHVTLMELKLWRDGVEYLNLLKRCLECENPDALFKEGLYGYIAGKNQELGLRYLKKAYEKGHVEATYVYGIILICSGGQFKQQGLEILSSLINCKLGGSRIEECRRTIENHMQCLWKINRIVPNQESYFHCNNCKKVPDFSGMKTVACVKGDYILDEDGKFMCCDYRRCEHEATLFCNRFFFKLRLD